MPLIQLRPVPSATHTNAKETKDAHNGTTHNFYEVQ